MSKRDSKPGPQPAAEAEVKLSLEDTIARKMRGVATKRSVASGYNPYNAEPTASSKNLDGKRKATDLRKLSEWIRLKREVAELSQETPKKK